MSVIILIPYNKMFNTVTHRRLQHIQDPTVINTDTDKDKGDSQKYPILLSKYPLSLSKLIRSRSTTVTIMALHLARNSESGKRGQLTL